MNCKDTNELARKVAEFANRLDRLRHTLSEVVRTHHQDANLDLLQLGIRFYDPEIGRFTQQDPLGDSLNWYAYVSGSPARYVDPQGLTRREAIDTLRQHRRAIRRVAGSFGVQPELLGGVVYVEMYSGGVPHCLNEAVSILKFLAGDSASLGITQVTLDPSKVSGCDTYEGRLDFLSEYLTNPYKQLTLAAAILRKLAKRRYGKEFGELNKNEMAIVLTEYNRGGTSTPNKGAMPSKYGRRFLGAFRHIASILDKK